MGFLAHFFGSGHDARDSELEAEIVSAVRDGLDIETVMAAHENWKYRLLAYLDGVSKEQFSAEDICFDDRCDLGKWIHSSGQARLGKFPGFTALLGHHKMFHYSASNVVALSKAGKEADARHILEGQFESFSKAVVGDLKALHDVVDRANAKKRH